jgi:hypothetical protein
MTLDPAALEVKMGAVVDIIRPQPGEVVIFQFPRDLTPPEAENLHAQFDGFFPAGVKVLLIGPTMKIMVVPEREL